MTEVQATIGMPKRLAAIAMALALVITILCISIIVGWSQERSGDVYVDKQGVMRWGHDKSEVRAFGINYTAMFAHAYRTAKRLNVPLEKAIDADVYHFARLGFDAFRVHVWDTEISDSLGNLLRNEHLRLFDYAISRMKERGMKFVITPIAYWGNGWPEPDEKTPGFSAKYGKDACLTHPDAIKAQERYLFQFLNHVNEYTGVAYKADPSVMAFEVSNEPHHGGSAAQVTAFINKMVRSMRKTGCDKPIFYNVSHSIHLVDAYFDADIQGGTFQWYPTGLGAGHELQGNFLPNVDEYKIPFADHPKFKRMAKLVYEFDAADVGRSYIYPAMARSFREAGMQIAAHFAYDPTFMADVNTEYGTHYMNLVYAPRKALSLMIAGEVFRALPMYQHHGPYPANTTFGDFRVSYEDDLAEMLDEKKFLHTNHTSSLPPAPDQLETVAGFGTSPVVAYEGDGAYFLDRIKAGVWRLEILPDAIWIDDPFEKASPRKKVATVAWKNRPIVVRLPDLGSSFAVRGINDGNSVSTSTEDGSFAVSPGTYLLTRKGIPDDLHASDRWKNIRLGEFAAPAQTLENLHVHHIPATSVLQAKPYTITSTIASPDSIQSVELYTSLEGHGKERMKETRAGQYEIQVPAGKMKAGVLRYYIVVKTKDTYYTFPSGLQMNPLDWDFYDREPYEVNVLPAPSPVMLFNAATDADRLSRRWQRSTRLVPSWAPGTSELQVVVEDLLIENPAYAIYDYSMRFFVGDRVKQREDESDAKERIIFRGRSLGKEPCPLQIALVTRGGLAYGGIISVGTESGEYELAIADLKKVSLVLLPRPYPTFLPYYFEDDRQTRLDMRDVEALLLSIGPGIETGAREREHRIGVESIRLQ